MKPLRRPWPGFNIQLFYSYVSILLITLFLFSLVVYFGTSSMLKDRLARTGSETVSQAALNLRQYMDDVEQLMFNVVVAPAVQNVLSNQNDKTDFEAVLEGERITSQMISVDVFSKKTGGIYLFAANQKNYPIYRAQYLRPDTGQSTKSAVFRAEEVRDEQWYQNAVTARGKNVWETPWVADDGSEMMFSASRSILNTKKLQQSMGVVRVLVPYSRIESTLKSISFGAEGTAYLLADGKIFGAGSAEERRQVAVAIGNSTSPISYHRLGAERFCVIRCDINQDGWQVIGIMPEQTMLGQFQFIKHILVSALLLALLLALIIIGLISQRLSQPIHLVAYAMHNFDTNRLRRFPESRRDEIGVLYRSFNRMMNHIDMLLSEVRETDGRKRQAELQALQAQINPHFLYNTLDSIKSLACLRNEQDIIQLTSALSEFFRISLNKGSETLPLSRELDHVARYCEIQNFRHRSSIALRVEVPEPLRERTVLKLILQPLVENAILHGFVDAHDGGFVEIRAFERGNVLILQVIDNGDGADIEYLNGLLSGEYTVPPEKAGGYGIINVDERLRLTFGGESGLFYQERENGGVIAEIRIAQRAACKNREHGYGENQDFTG